MDARHLFQLGTTDLGSGTAQTEGDWGWGSDRSASERKAKRADLSDDTGTGAALKAPTPTQDAPNAAPDASTDLAGNTEDDHFIRRDGKVYAGTHLIIEVIDADGLNDQVRIEKAFHDCIEACGATLLHIHLHAFAPQGVSGVAVLAESHISVHTWPERGYGAFDVFMCGGADPHAAVPVLKSAFSAAEVRVTEFLRGEGLVGE